MILADICSPSTVRHLCDAAVIRGARAVTHAFYYIKPIPSLSEIGYVTGFMVLLEVFTSR